MLNLDILNPAQKEAVLHQNGPLLVLAGAGSGKTRVIVYKIARLLEQNVPANRILGVTFTNKAARQMRERLRELAGKASQRVELLTFHALGLQILKQEHVLAGLQPNFCIYDTSDQISLVRDLMRQVKVADRRLDPHRVLDLLLSAKRQRLAEIPLQWGDDYEMAAFDLYPRYLEQMRAFNAIDFDDLLLRCQDVFADPQARARWAQRYSYLLIDEYQDTSPDQLNLVQILSGHERNVCAVGDDDQAIYAWRGAAVDNILNFSKHFANTREVFLTQNYRSTNFILRAANEVIQHNLQRKPKKLWSAGDDGEPVKIVACQDGEDEAIFVGETMLKLHYQGVPWSDMAILYRSNTQSRLFEEQLALERIPFRLIGGQAFFDRKEVRDAMAFLAVCHNPNDEVALRRIINVPARGIGPATLERLAHYGQRQLDLKQRPIGLLGALRDCHRVDGIPGGVQRSGQELAQLLLQASQQFRAARPKQAAPIVRDLFAKLHLRDAILAADDSPNVGAKRLENLDEAVASLERFEARLAADAAPLAEFMRASALVRQKEEEGQEAQDQATLMTLHSAKGLEFPYVFMVGMEEDLLPHKRTVEEGSCLGEERRLCYVGITRARTSLWLTHAKQRVQHGRMQPRTPSRFLEDLPKGEGLVRIVRAEEIQDVQAQDDMAAQFFKKMRAQLGIES